MSARLVWTATPTFKPDWIVGSLVRWREVPRYGRWTYAYFRGVDDGLLTFSDTPSGPITTWSRNREMEFATCLDEGGL